MTDAYQGNASVVSDPASVDGYQVDVIMSGAFNGSITDITITDEILSLDESRFYECTAIDSAVPRRNESTMKSKLKYGINDEKLLLSKSVIILFSKGSTEGVSGTTAIDYEEKC